MATAAKFRKRPVEIEATTFDGTWASAEAIIDWIDQQTSVSFEQGSLYIQTLEGRMEAKPGDWIIKGVKGEFYPCRHDIFTATYDPAE